MSVFVPHPIDSVIAITYNCNSRCVMCDIWKIKDFPELPPSEYAKIPKTLRDINISGGEPFLRTDIADIIAVIQKRCPKARMVISTNGFMPTLIETQMKKILAIKPDIGVAVSVDGYGDMHEKIRGIPNAWDKDMETIERLQKLGMTNLRLAFTILPENVGDFAKVYDETKKRGIQFTHAFAQSSEHYFGGIQIENNPNIDILKEQYAYVIKQELRGWNLKRFARAFFAKGLYDFAVNKIQPLNIDPGRRFCYIDPRGVVFPSVVHSYPMGYLTDVSSWDELWQGERAQMAREKVRTDSRRAWMICTARTAIMKHPFEVGQFVLSGKISGVRLDA